MIDDGRQHCIVVIKLDGQEVFVKMTSHIMVANWMELYHQFGLQWIKVFVMMTSHIMVTNWTEEREVNFCITSLGGNGSRCLSR